MLLNKVCALLRHICFRPLTFNFLLAPALLVATATLANETDNNSNNIHIRTLASSCAACHGTNGNSHSITPVLAGLDAHYFSTQMFAFKEQSRTSTVMHHHATGLTKPEINQLADYFSQQKRTTPPPLTSEVLRGKP